jgi:uncharacterized protein YbjT (DUF2867 family)
MSTILVTGGTGTLGRVLVIRLAGAGHKVRVLSRRPRPPSAEPHAWATGDLRRGQGIAEAVAGADVIIHCATAARGDDVAAANLMATAHRGGAPHLVYISIVGVDTVPLGYYRTKLKTERLIRESGLPWTIQRTTQFHDLILLACTALARLPVMLVPAGISFQPLDVAEVAERLARLAAAPAAGRVPDMAGPQVRSSAELARSYLRVAGRRRGVLPVWLPGAAAVGFRRGGHLAPGNAVGRVTFEQFLDRRLGAGGSR